MIKNLVILFFFSALGLYFIAHGMKDYGIPDSNWDFRFLFFGGIIIAFVLLWAKDISIRDERRKFKI